MPPSGPVNGVHLSLANIISVNTDYKIDKPNHSPKSKPLMNGIFSLTCAAELSLHIGVLFFPASTSLRTSNHLHQPQQVFHPKVGAPG